MRDPLPAIETVGVRKRFGDVVAVDGVSLTVRRAARSTRSSGSTARAGPRSSACRSA